MSWPTPQDYNEAIQNPHLCFAHQELRAGRVEMTPLGLPRAMSGAFASVYRLTCPSGDYAIRCFTSCRGEQKERYERISEFIRLDDLDCTVDFHYLEEGIRVRGKWYPVVQMDWVDGETLDQYIAKRYRDREAMVDLSERIFSMGTALDRAGIAHGDLQHGNIIIPFFDKGLRLVDYDGLYVPALKGRKSIELGHANYQHPQRNEWHFDTTIDNFSLWLIYLSINALAIDPELMPALDGGDECILLREKDLKDPQSSRAFSILSEHQSSEIRDYAVLLTRMLWASPESVPELECVIEELEALPSVHTLDFASLEEVRRMSVNKHLTDSGSRDHMDTWKCPLSSSPGILLINSPGADKVESINRIKKLREANENLTAAKRNKTSSAYFRDLSGKVSNFIRKRTSSFLKKNTPEYWASYVEQQGDKLANSGKYEAAIKKFLEASKTLESRTPILTSNQLELHFKIGACFGLSSNYEMAANYYRLIINEISASRFEKYENRARFMLFLVNCMQIGQVDEMSVVTSLMGFELSRDISWIVDTESKLKLIIDSITVELLCILARIQTRRSFEKNDPALMHSAKAFLVFADSLAESLGNTNQPESVARNLDIKKMLAINALDLDEKANARGYLHEAINLARIAGKDEFEIEKLRFLLLGTRGQKFFLSILEDNQISIPIIDPQALEFMFEELVETHTETAGQIAVNLFKMLTASWSDIEAHKREELLAITWLNLLRSYLGSRLLYEFDLKELLLLCPDEAVIICLSAMHEKRLPYPKTKSKTNSWLIKLCNELIDIQNKRLLTLAIYAICRDSRDNADLLKIRNRLSKKWNSRDIAKILRNCLAPEHHAFIALYFSRPYRESVLTLFEDAISKTASSRKRSSNARLAESEELTDFDHMLSMLLTSKVDSVRKLAGIISRKFLVDGRLSLIYKSLRRIHAAGRKVSAKRLAEEIFSFKPVAGFGAFAETLHSHALVGDLAELVSLANSKMARNNLVELLVEMIETREYKLVSSLIEGIFLSFEEEHEYCEETLIRSLVAFIRRARPAFRAEITRMLLRYLISRSKMELVAQLLVIYRSGGNFDNIVMEIEKSFCAANAKTRLRFLELPDLMRACKNELAVRRIAASIETRLVFLEKELGS